MSGASVRQGQDYPTNATHRGSDRVAYWKVGAAGFPRLLFYFPPNLLDAQQHKDLTGAADPYADVSARACTF